MSEEVSTTRTSPIVSFRGEGNYHRQLIANSRNLDRFFPSVIDEAGTVRHDKPLKTYPPGSSYKGEWAFVHTWDGEGQYVFPHGVTYDGRFSDSQFDGPGSLRYPRGQTLKGVWRRGKMVSWDYVFGDGLKYYMPWEYCMFPERAFNSTLQSGEFKPPGRERITNKMPPRVIPPGCYDVGEGFYNPKLCCIVSATEDNKIMRIPTADETAWIKKHCRSAEVTNVGYRPDLYEYWSSGTSGSVNDILEQIEFERWTKYRGESGGETQI